MEDLKLDMQCKNELSIIVARSTLIDTFNNAEKKYEDFSGSVHAVVHFRDLGETVDLPDYN